MAILPAGSKLLLHMDGTDGSMSFVDSSITKKVVTANGNAQIDTAQSKFGGASGLFDGSGDYLSIPNHADFNFGTGDFTIELWARLNVDANMDFIGNGYDVGWMVQYITTLTPDRLRIWLENTNYDFNTTLSINTWYHIAFARSGTNLRCFVNGTQVGSTLSSSENITTTNGLRVGVDVTDPTYTNGWIDELLIVKGRALYTANFTPQTTAYKATGNAIFFGTNF